MVVQKMNSYLIGADDDLIEVDEVYRKLREGFAHTNNHGQN